MRVTALLDEVGLAKTRKRLPDTPGHPVPVVSRADLLIAAATAGTESLTA